MPTFSILNPTITAIILRHEKQCTKLLTLGAKLGCSYHSKERTKRETKVTVAEAATKVGHR